MQGWIHRGLLGQYQQAKNNACIIVWPHKPQSEGDWAQVEFTIKEQSMKSLEELAEIVDTQSRAAFGFEPRPWSEVSKESRGAALNATIAIIREVLGPVTDEEAKPYKAGSMFRQIVDELLDHRLDNYTRTASPVEAPKPDNEVERVAKAMWDDGENQNKQSWATIHEADKNDWRKQARAAIAAMGGGKRWGVWAMPEGFASKGAFVEVGVCGSKSTTDKALCESVVDLYRRNGDAAALSVREYTPPAAMGWEECMRAAEEVYPANETFTRGELLMRFARKFSAIRHLKGGE